MNTPINLNKARKERARIARRTRGDENAVKFGLTKAEKDALKTSNNKVIRHLDDHKRET